MLMSSPADASRGVLGLGFNPDLALDFFPDDPAVPGDVVAFAGACTHSGRRGVSSSSDGATSDSRAMPIAPTPAIRVLGSTLLSSPGDGAAPSPATRLNALEPGPQSSRLGPAASASASGSEPVSYTHLTLPTIYSV